MGQAGGPAALRPEAMEVDQGGDGCHDPDPDENEVPDEGESLACNPFDRFKWHFHSRGQLGGISRGGTAAVPAGGRGGSTAGGAAGAAGRCVNMATKRPPEGVGAWGGEWC